jgi:hypothetical protein
VTVEYPGRGARKPTAGVSSSGRLLGFAGIGEIEAAAGCGGSPGQEGGGAVRPAPISTGDTGRPAKDAFGNIDVGHLGLPEGDRYGDYCRNVADLPYARQSPLSDVRHTKIGL